VLLMTYYKPILLTRSDIDIINHYKLLILVLAFLPVKQ